MPNSPTLRKPGYIICTSPRSGSTLLCTMLADTERAGQPWSFFHEHRFMQEWAEAWHLPARGSLSEAVYEAAYIQATSSAGRGGTSVFGMRLQRSYLPLLAAMLGRLHPDAFTDADRLELAFGPLRYVHLTRRDKVAQAVSLVIARQTGLWHRHADGSERERSGPAAEPAFDFIAIDAEVHALTEADQTWRAWFERQAIKPLSINYEALAADPAGTVIRLCTTLGIALPNCSVGIPATAPLADELSQAWMERYRAEAGRERAGAAIGTA